MEKNIKHAVALWNSEYIPIESVFTVVNGKQINISGKVEELRVKGRRNELFCPCGCVSNLILVASDKNLRNQHFRKKKGTGKYICTAQEEGYDSICSRIVLKCWFEDKLKTDDIMSRVPINLIEDVNRKPEFTLLSMKRKLGLRYWKTRANLCDEKIDVLSGNQSGINVIYVVDSSNENDSGQYPEALMKIQNKQSFCLLLKIDDVFYDRASLKVVFYEKNVDQVWTENDVCEGPLIDFSFDDNNYILFRGESVSRLALNAKETFKIEQDRVREQRIQEEKKREEERTRQQLEWQKRREQQEAEYEEKQRKIREAEEKKRIEKEREIEKIQKQNEAFIRYMTINFAEITVPIKDGEGYRWRQCKYCGKKAKDSEFGICGGLGREMNLGTCKECDKKPEIKEQRNKEWLNSLANRNKDIGRKNETDTNKCPDCGGILVTREGRRGKFLGCVNFPRCYFTKNI